MLTTLSPAETYLERGYLSPVPAIGAGAALNLRARLEAYEDRNGGPLKGHLRHKSHLLFPWLYDLVRHPAILDAAEGLLGPDLLCWGATFFVKEARDPGFVSWHQDSTYWGLSSPEVMTAWVAFSPSTVESGCMQVIPGSHKHDQLPHVDRYHADNLLTRGQEVEVEVDEAQAVDIVLDPGEMSLHHVRLIHGSPPNRSADRRIGFAIRYIPTHVRQLGGRDFATLVRGRDQFGHFEPEPAPKGEADPEALATHEAVMRRHTELLMAGAARAELK